MDQSDSTSEEQKQQQNSKQSSLDNPLCDDGHIYCHSIDNFGCEAYESVTVTQVQDEDYFCDVNSLLTHNGATIKPKNGEDSLLRSVTKRIRLQARPDACLAGIDSAAQILNKIEQIRDTQSMYGKRPSDLYARQWESTEQETSGEIPSANGDVNGEVKHQNTSLSFSVMQFNTLAEGLSAGPSVQTPFPIMSDDSNSKGNTRQKDITRGGNNFGGFTKLPNPEVTLDFALRRWRLLEVILSNYDHPQEQQQPVIVNGDSSAIDGIGRFDLMAMEEVDRYHGFFEPALKLFGYSGLFVPKPSSPGTKLGWYSDGCALFWKESCFKLLSEERKRFNDGTQVYIVATLQHIPSAQTIVVAVAHLKAQNSDVNEKIRTKQADQLVASVHEVTTEVAAVNDVLVDDVPIIILGDLNSELSTGFGKTCVRSILNRNEQPKFWSAYPIDPMKTYGMYSTWKTRGEKTVRRIIDYIFHNKELHCTHVLSIPKETDVEPERLPGFRYPSDHLMIGAKYHLNRNE